MRFGSLFAGIGGFDLGLERAGMTCAWQVEIDPWCRRVLAGHWPDVPRYGDIREVTELEPVELVCGGFPCQPVSEVGARRGKDDPRWLWPEFARVVGMVRPRYVLVENVANLLSFGEFGEILGDLAALGFDAEWSLVPACALGSPHSRERLFLVAYRDDPGFQARWHRRDRDDAPANGGRVDPQHLYPSALTTGSYRGHLWPTEPSVVRVVDGLPEGLDADCRRRNHALGNAVVPPLVEWLGRKLMEAAA